MPHEFTAPQKEEESLSATANKGVATNERQLRNIKCNDFRPCFLFVSWIIRSKFKLTSCNCVKMALPFLHMDSDGPQQGRPDNREFDSF